MLGGRGSPHTIHEQGTMDQGSVGHLIVIHLEKHNASSSIQSSDFVNASLRAQSLKALKCLGYL